MAELTWGCEVKPGRVIEVPLEGMDVTLSQAALDLPGNAAPKRGSHWATLYAQCKDWPKPLAVCTLTEGPGTQHCMLNTSFYVQDRIVTLTSKGNATMHLIGTITDYSEGGDIEDEEDEEDEEAEEAEASSAEESVDDEDEESEAQVAPAPSPASSKKQKPARGKKRGRANSSDSAEAPAAAATAATTEAPPTKQQRRAAAKAARRQQAEAEAAAKQSKSARPVKEVGGAARRDVVNHKSGLKYVDQEVGRGKRPQAGKKVTIR